MSSIITGLLKLPLWPVLLPLRFLKMAIIWPIQYAIKLMFTSPRYFFKIIWYGPQLVMDILFSFDSLLEVLALVALIGIITGLAVHFTYVGICHTLNVRFPPTAYPRTTAASKRIEQKYGQTSNGSLRKRSGRTRTGVPQSSTNNRRPNTSESPKNQPRSPLLPLISTHLTPQTQQSGGRAGTEGTHHGGPDLGGGLSTGLSPPLSPSANLSRRIGGSRDSGGPVLGSTIVEEEDESSSDF